MKYFKKKTAVIMAICFFISLFNIFTPDIAGADENEYTSKVDVVFLVDSSKSMMASDPQGISAEAMKMFIDMCHIKGDKGGMVAYSGDIIKEFPLSYMNSDVDKTALKNTLTNIQLGDWTDIGLGLKRAVSILKNGHDEKNKPIIILLSDGKNDPQRNKAASLDDLASALNEAKVQNIPVYTIGLNADGSVDKNQLELISGETGGRSFITSYAKELPQILRDIFADNFSLKISQQNTITGNNDYQDVAINIPDSNVVEANITLLSSNPVEIKLIDSTGKEVNVPSGKVLYTRSGKYSMVKLVSPEKGSWTLKVKGTPGDQIDISLISNYDFKTIMNLKPETDIHKGDKINVTAFIESNGKMLEDKEFISTLKAAVLMKNLSNGKVQELPLTEKDNEFSGEITVPDDNNYEIAVKIEGTSFVRQSAAKIIGAVNRAPVSGNNSGTIILWSKNIKSVNLAEYFKDPDNDKLKYEVSSSSMDTLNMKVNGDRLELQGRKWGSDRITLIAEDGKGGKISRDITVKVWFMIYILPFIAAGSLIIIISALIIKKRNAEKKITAAGQMMLQVKDNETGNVSEPFYKDLDSLGHQFSIHVLLDLKPDYEDTAKILLRAVKDDRLLLINNSRFVIEFQGGPVNASKGFSIKNNDKVEIVMDNRIISMKYYRWNSTIFVESLFQDIPDNE